MSALAPADDALPDLLVQQGWQQGAVFSALAVRFWCTDVADSRAAELALVARSRPTAPEERFVVASQTCDIKDKLEREPSIEALLCTIEPDRNWRATISKSARWFEVDRSIGLVAHAMYRVHVDKRALLGIAPEPWPDSSQRLHRFGRWLGHRFNRPAIPDPIVEAFQWPAENAIGEMRKKRAGVFRAFNSAVREIRISLPEEETPPFDIHVVLLIDGKTLSANEADAIETVLGAIRHSLDPSRVSLGPDRLVTDEQMSAAEYFATRPLYLESLTYRGDEVEGAEPPASVQALPSWLNPADMSRLHDDISGSRKVGSSARATQPWLAGSQACR